MSSRRHKEILVVVHDAGAAEVIAAYVCAYRTRRYRIYTAGPARRIFSRKGLSSLPAPRTLRSMAALMQKHSNVAFALLGTGWTTTIEANALIAAKHAKIRTIVYLDSWINYRERFGYPARGWRKNLPDELWVGDTAAVKMAKNRFPSNTIRFVRNRYFDHVIKRYREKNRHGRDVLYVSAAGPISRTLLKDLLRATKAVNSNLPIRIRMHPADDRTAFAHIIRNSRVNAKLSQEKDIVEDLVRARVVVGPETVALVPAHMVGIKTIRIVPRGEKSFLPFPRIRTVRNAEAAARLVFRKV